MDEVLIQIFLDYSIPFLCISYGFVVIRLCLRTISENMLIVPRKKENTFMEKWNDARKWIINKLWGYDNMKDVLGFWSE